MEVKNRLTQLLAKNTDELLNIYFTAGYPELGDTTRILKALEEAGADMVEIGMPYSDPLADGPVIQQASEKALANGMSISVLLDQLEEIRKETKLPIMLMGYINPVLQYGIENFVRRIAEIGIDGLILPDLPYLEYKTLYQDLFESYHISNIFLVTPQTSDERLKLIDEVTQGFIYVVSTNSTTGNKAKSISDMTPYFERIKSSGIKSPTMIGFNIKDQGSFKEACQYAKGGIIGTAFIKALSDSNDVVQTSKDFVNMIKG